MDALKRSRATIKGQITRIDSAAKTETQVAKLKVLKSRLEHYMLQYEHVQSEIDLLHDEGEESESQYRSEVETLYYGACAMLSQKIEDNTPLPSSFANVSGDLNTTLQALLGSQAAINDLVKGIGESKRPITITKVDSQTRLPEIKLPEFTGKLSEWIRFRDLFTALVASKSSLSGIEKFEHLQTRLRGDALSIIKHLTPSDENFDVAWKLIKEHFDKPNFITIAHLDNIFNTPSLKVNSLDELKAFFNTVYENLNALRALKQPVDSWDIILVYVLVKKLDDANNILWFRKQKGTEKPGLQDFLDFLKERIDELECLNVSRDKQSVKLPNKAHNKRVLSAAVQHCIKCKGNHFLYQCEQFRDLSVSSRLELVRNNKICVNCLRSKHNLSECKFSVCRQCGQRHNSLLHEHNSMSSSSPSTSSSSTSNNNSVSLHVSQHTVRNVSTLLPTAMILIADATGKSQKCRALLDSGSQTTLITEACVQRLGLKRQHARIPISGIGNGQGVHGTRGRVNLDLQSATARNFSIKTTAYILSRLTGDLPSILVPRDKISFFDNLTLADPDCHKPAKIDLLIGSDIFFDVITEGKVIHPSGAPTAHNTNFGWVIAGNVLINDHQNLICGHSAVDLDILLKRFWEFEDCPEIRQPVRDTESQIEEHFLSTHLIQSDGRYVVRLPFKSETIEFGNSRSAALKRLYAMERRFAQNEELRRDYVQFMREYEDLGHMKVAPVCADQSKSFYLPHHAVIKSSSTTTKLRVVFDASNKADNGLSLNDCLVVGPTIQRDLFTHLIKFRKFRVAIKADVAKMYRQVLVNKEDVDYQRIVWRESENEKPRDYQLLTVTYGTAPASFLATRVLKQVGIRSLYKYPNAGNSIINDFYVDDYMSGYNSLEDACQVKNDICLILSQAGMELRKWASNSVEFLSEIDPESRELSTNLSIGENNVKTLGLLWDTELDSFKFDFHLPLLESQITKREVLSDIARMFDPMGWLAPMIVKMKILMKKLWIQGIGWNSFIPSELYQEWADFRNDLHHISGVSISRWINHEPTIQMQLHGFADASESAYAAAIYSRIFKPDGSVYTSLICAKSRVAPVKPALTVPRLELCASLLLVRLFSTVKEALGIHDIQCYAYSDSSTVLHWIQGYPRRRNVFVDNRLSQIAAALPSSAWHYVRSADNPADCATRGLMPKQLLGLDLWWKGPIFIRKPVIEFAKLMYLKKSPEDEVVALCTLSAEPDWMEIDHFSCFNKLLRVVARCVRLFRCSSAHYKLKFGRRPNCLSIIDIKSARIVLYKLSQSTFFANELDCLRRNKAISNKSRILQMNPFIDEDGILRVGGRIEYANIPFSQRHPVILHKDHHLTRLIVLDYHQRNMHAGIRLMTYLLSLEHSIVGAHHVIKQCVYKCVTCIKQRATPYKQQMGNLPRHRLEPGLAFNSTGVDLAGPFVINSWKGRGAKRFKAYIVLFVCMSTKALHLEAVTELSSAAFIAALRRFVSRRGKCHTLFSDNGTNFVGANQQLREWAALLDSTQFQEDVSNQLNTEGIEWRFIPPYAPNFGGLWEAGVKTVKYHLRRVMGNASVTLEEFFTILCQIEACANSRPLCTRFDGDTDPLTPAHFLILRPMKSVPDEDLSGARISSLKRWQFVQRTVQDFWSRWSNEYLSQMQKRTKWANANKNAEVNDVVVIKEDNQPPCRWLIGKITKTFPGRDGLARVALVKTSKGELKRSISKLCPLLAVETKLQPGEDV